MKKLLFATLFAVVSVSSFAADEVKFADDSKSISYSVLNQFAVEFADATNVTWTLTSQSQKATFTLDGQKVSAFYSPAGDYLGATKFISIDQVPAKAKTEIAKKFPDYSLNYAIQVISRPYSSNGSDDTGSYWVDIISNKKELYLKVSSFGSVDVIKELEAK